MSLFLCFVVVSSAVSRFQSRMLMLAEPKFYEVVYVCIFVSFFLAPLSYSHTFGQINAVVVSESLFCNMLSRYLRFKSSAL
jgi:hypothetical protein